MSKKRRPSVRARKSRDTAYIVHPVLPRAKQQEQSRDLESLLAEAAGLARAINLDVVTLKVAKIQKISPGYLIGEGNREIIAEEVADLKPTIVIVNHNLTPVQQRNLEKQWKAKVLDRTGLILEIFGARAQTREGKLQVRLAALEYQRSRLVRQWTHLERQRGGSGFLGGPGELQKELDRRRLDDLILGIKKGLEDVRRTRNISRKSRERIPLPVVALVGYTNAGKSTLFNRLTDANVFAADVPFATLDPTLRKIKLPGRREAILSDTVGFISNLPTNLVASFRATLEQITYADVIIHVIDVSQRDHEAQKSDVIKILGDLGIEYDSDARIIEAYNKIDRAGRDLKQDFERKQKFGERSAVISALTGSGLDRLLATVADVLSGDRIEVTFRVDAADGRAISFLYDHGEVVKRQDKDDKTMLKVKMDESEIGKFESRYGYKPVRGRKKK
ncbi:MAG: GTPase HflX [Alphaproteobacteria bacterium]